MSGIWSSQAAQAETSPWGGLGKDPAPGGKTGARVQPSGRLPGAAAGTGLSPAAGRTGRAMASAADSTSGASAASDTGTTITSNDFLSLLVTEMQNQDPTADTDPNEYINQLVQINSLEQLISINENLSEVLGAASSTSSGTAGPASVGHAASGARPLAATGTGGPQEEVPAKKGVQGNLSAPAGSPAAHTVAHALDGRNRGPGHGHGIRDIPTH